MALERALAKAKLAVMKPRTPDRLPGIVAQRWLDAVVLGPRVIQKIELDNFRSLYPRLPLLVFGNLRADDAGLMVSWYRRGVEGLLVEGVDDSIAGEAISRQTSSFRRQEAIRPLAEVFRLRSDWQLKAWGELLRHGFLPLSSDLLAHKLRVSREYLSRQFGAGGAPNLKRVIDFLRVTAAADLSGNPGYPPATVARLLRFVSVRQLRVTVTRTVGLGLDELPGADLDSLVRGFLALGMRSRAD